MLVELSGDQCGRSLEGEEEKKQERSLRGWDGKNYVLTACLRVLIFILRARRNEGLEAGQRLAWMCILKCSLWLLCGEWIQGDWRGCSDFSL